MYVALPKERCLIFIVQCRAFLVAVAVIIATIV